MTSSTQEPVVDLTRYIRDIPDFPKPGIIFKDITPLLKDGPAFRQAVDLLAGRAEGQGVTRIVGIESRGFIFAAAVAYRLGAGVVPVRKKGKLPHTCISESYELEYGIDCVEMHEDALSPGERVMVVDDVIATGGTLAAACRLVKQLGAEVVEAATVIELTFLPGREKLEGVPFSSLIQF